MHLFAFEYFWTIYNCEYFSSANKCLYIKHILSTCITKNNFLHYRAYCDKLGSGVVQSIVDLLWNQLGHIWSTGNVSNQGDNPSLY